MSPSDQHNAPDAPEVSTQARCASLAAAHAAIDLAVRIHGRKRGFHVAATLRRRTHRHGEPRPCGRSGGARSREWRDLRVIASGTPLSGAATAPTAPTRGAAIPSVSEMRGPPAAQEGAGAVNPSPGDEPAPSDFAPAYAPVDQARRSALEFWRRVNKGVVRLSPENDARITALKHAGCSWVEITRRIRAAHATEQRMTRNANYVERKRGLRWRDQYRRNKGEQR